MKRKIRKIGFTKQRLSEDQTLSLAIRRFYYVGFGNLEDLSVNYWNIIQALGLFFYGYILVFRSASLGEACGASIVETIL